MKADDCETVEMISVLKEWRKQYDAKSSEEEFRQLFGQARSLNFPRHGALSQASFAASFLQKKDHFLFQILSKGTRHSEKYNRCLQLIAASSYKIPSAADTRQSLVPGILQRQPTIWLRRTNKLALWDIFPSEGKQHISRHRVA